MASGWASSEWRCFCSSLSGSVDVDGRRVADDMQVVLAEVEDLRAALIEDVGVADVPLAWDDPVECLRARRDLVDGQRHVLLEDAQRLAARRRR